MAELVLVTGASGTLGRALIPVLLERGDRVRAIDIRLPTGVDSGVDWQTVDLRDAAAVARATKGVTLAVHGAAWHGMHLREHSARDFWELNVNGTFNLYEACAAEGTRAVDLSSSMGVYGLAGAPPAEGGAVRIHEGLAPQPTDIYGASKLVCEQLAGYYARSRGVRGVALRYGMFVPEPFAHYGVRMLYGGVDERDVAAAVVTGLDRAADGGLQFGAYNVVSSLPYTDGDARELRTDPMAVIRRHWPDVEDLLARANVEPWGPIHNWYDVARASADLGWRPRWNFDQFLRAIRAGVSEASRIQPAKWHRGD